MRALAIALMLGGCAAVVTPPSPTTTATPSASPRADLRGAEQVYREHLAAMNVPGVDEEAYSSGFAEHVTCFEGRENVSRGALREIERPAQLVPITIEPQALSPHAVRVRAWVWRRVMEAPDRIEPRIARLHFEDGAWRIVSEIAWEQDCGFDDGMAQMEVPDAIEACLAAAQRECRSGLEASWCWAQRVRECLLPEWRRASPEYSSSIPLVPSACASGWCVVHPPAGPRLVSDVWAAAADDVWAASRHGLARFDGSDWEWVGGVDGAVVGVRGLPSGRLVAYGTERVWMRAPGEAQWQLGWESEHDSLWDIDVRGDDDVWITGGYGRIVRFDGHAWRAQPRVTSDAVWGVFEDPSAGIVAFTDGTPLRYDGRYWEPLESYRMRVQDVVRASDGTRLVVERAEGAALVRRDRDEWTDETRLPEPLHRLIRHSDGWAGLGARGLWETVDGEWRNTAPQPRGDEWAALASVGDTLLTGGRLGVRARRGAAWDPPPAYTVERLVALDARAADDVWAIGESSVLHWDGDAVRDATPDARHLRLDWVAVTRRGVTVGGPTATYVRAGDGWRAIEHRDRRVESVARIGEDIVGLVEHGDEVVLVRWRADRWEDVLRAPRAHRKAVIGPRALLTSGYRSGSDEGGTIVYDGRRRRVLDPAATPRQLVRMHAVGRGVLAADYEDLHRFDGRRFVLHSRPPRELVSICGESLDRLVGVDGAGGLHVYDGGAWTSVTLPEGARVSGALAVGGELWAVGEGGLFMRRPAAAGE